MGREHRIDNQPAYVLHSWPYRETSLLVELFTRHYGRLMVVARGARRPKSDLRGVLLAFQPLDVSWFGKGEVKTLHDADWEGGLPQLNGEALLCAFYLNELLLRLLHRDDPHEALFDDYAKALAYLSHGADPAVTLRRFELSLLAQLGYGLRLVEEVDGTPVEPRLQYHYLNERGPVLSRANESGSFRGQTLLDCARGEFDDPVTRTQARRLLRQVLQHHLGPEPMQSRLLLLDWPETNAG